MGHRRRELGSTMELQWHESVCVAAAFSRNGYIQIFIMPLLSLPCSPLGEESPDGFLPTGPLHTLYSIPHSLSYLSVTGMKNLQRTRASSQKLK